MSSAVGGLKIFWTGERGGESGTELVGHQLDIWDGPTLCFSVRGLIVKLYRKGEKRTV